MNGQDLNKFLDVNDESLNEAYVRKKESQLETIRYSARVALLCGIFDDRCLASPLHLLRSLGNNHPMLRNIVNSASLLEPYTRSKHKDEAVRYSGRVAVLHGTYSSKCSESPLQAFRFFSKNSPNLQMIVNSADLVNPNGININKCYLKEREYEVKSQIFDPSTMT